MDIDHAPGVENRYQLFQSEIADAARRYGVEVSVLLLALTLEYDGAARPFYEWEEYVPFLQRAAADLREEMKKL